MIEGEGEMRKLCIFPVIPLIILGCTGMNVFGLHNPIKRQSLMKEPIEGKIVIAKEIWKKEEGEMIRKGSQLYIMNADGSNYHPIPNTLFEGKEMKNPRWSPDGKKIVFHVYSYEKEGVNNQIYIINEDGSGCKEICKGGGDPSFFPNGEMIAFGKENEIYTIKINGTDFKQLTNEVEKENETGTYLSKGKHDVSPDGKKILFRGCKKHIETSKWEPGNIFIMNVDGTALKQIIFDDVVEVDYDSTPRWSPDGKKIVFIGREKVSPKGINQIDGIYVINSKGTNLRKISEQRGLGGYKEVCWSSDGKKIMYMYKVSTDWPLMLWKNRVELRIINVDGTNDELIKKVVDPKVDWCQTEATFDWWTHKR